MVLTLSLAREEPTCTLSLLSSAILSSRPLGCDHLRQLGSLPAASPFTSDRTPDLIQVSCFPVPSLQCHLYLQNPALQTLLQQAVTLATVFGELSRNMQDQHWSLHCRWPRGPEDPWRSRLLWYPCLLLPTAPPSPNHDPSHVSDTATCLLGGDRVTSQLETTGLTSQK